MYGPSAGTKKVAVVERWPLVEVRLYFNSYCITKNVKCSFNAPGCINRVHNAVRFDLFCVKQCDLLSLLLFINFCRYGIYSVG